VCFKKSFAELAMPTQRKEPRTNAGKRLFLKALERKKVLAISCVMNILPLLDAVLGVLENDKCLKRKGLQLVQLLLATTLLASSVLPHSYISPHCKMPTIDENPWVVQGTSDQFMDLFRFRRDDIITMLASFELVDNNSGEYKTFRSGGKIVNGRLRHHVVTRADTAFLLMLHRLSYPSRYHILIKDWGMYHCHMSKVFNHMIKYLYRKFAVRAMLPSIWADRFADFAQQFIDWGSPYKNLAMLVDGNFLYTARPGGAGNKWAKMDQEEIYNGYYKGHGIKFLAGIMPNGMVCLAGPFNGNTNDADMIEQSGWEQDFRRIYHATGTRHIMFGDSIFAQSEFVQHMLKRTALLPHGVNWIQAREFLAVMAELRVSIENFFAESHLMFNYMSASAQLKLGSMPIGQYYAVCTMLMNVHAIFYGNQILEKLGYSSLPSVEEYLGA
jgi:hypothetical protein